jgi:hypothetical protein
MGIAVAFGGAVYFQCRDQMGEGFAFLIRQFVQKSQIPGVAVQAVSNGLYRVFCMMVFPFICQTMRYKSQVPSKTTCAGPVIITACPGPAH